MDVYECIEVFLLASLLILNNKVTIFNILSFLSSGRFVDIINGQNKCEFSKKKWYGHYHYFFM